MAVIDRVGDSAARAVVNAVVERALRDGPGWFEHLDPATTRVTIGPGIRRPRCDLYRLVLSDGRGEAAVLAKVRRSRPDAPVGAGRPTLVRVERLPDVELARLEFAGLAMAAGTGRDDGAGIRVRPLALLPEHATLVMDHVAQPTLRRVLMGRTRVRVPSRMRAHDSCWSAAGAWLRRYHGCRPEGTAPGTRDARRADVLLHYAAFAGHLGRRLGDPAALDRIAAAATDLAERHLPADLPLVIGHGDFAPRNVLVDPDGRIAVIDPLPRWEVPPYEDLCRFLVNARCLGVQVASQGLALAEAQLQRYEDQFLRGYFGTAEVPVEALRAYSLLILLDKWSAAVTTAGDPVRRRWFARYYRREAARLLGTGGGSRGSR